jgi:hypothetical protein
VWCHLLQCLPTDNPYNQSHILSVDASYSMVAYGYFMGVCPIPPQTLGFQMVLAKTSMVSSINLVLFARIL